MKKTTSKNEEKIALDIIRVSHEIGVPLNQLTYTHYKKHGKFSYNELQKQGGFQSIIKHYFNYLTEPELTLLHAKRVKASYIRRLEARVGAQDYIVKEVSQELERQLKKYPIKIIKYPRPKHKRINRDKAIVAFISDTHFGLDISADETGVNKYNWTVAGRRMALFASKILETAKERGIHRLELCIGGDIAQGIVYTNDKGTHAVVTQILGSAHILINFIEFLASHFQKINVHCTPDNHMRLPSKGRDGLISQKWDSFATLLHIIMAKHFRAMSRVVFNVPLTPYTLFRVFDHVFFLTHGDTVLDIPYPSKVFPIEKINTEKIKLMHSGISDKIDAILIGHLHNPLCMPLNSGGMLIVNGTASGTDNYAISKGYLYNNPTQIFFIVDKHNPHESLHVTPLKSADNDKNYDSIIPSFKATTLGPKSII